MIYVLTATDDEIEYSSTVLLYASSDRDALLGLQARFESIVAKYEDVAVRRDLHLKEWEQANPQPIRDLPDAPLKPKGMPRKEHEASSAYKEWKDRSGSWVAVHREWAARRWTERERCFDAEMHKVLTPEEWAVYPKVGHYYNYTFSVQEVPPPDDFLALVKQSQTASGVEGEGEPDGEIQRS